jgi:hypothetical protein
MLFADPFAIPAPGVVAVREYGSSPRHRARSVSTKSTTLLVFFLAAGCRGRTVDKSSDSNGGSVEVTEPDGEGGAALSAEASAPPDDAVLPEPNEELKVRARHLLEAIESDDAALAGDILFPRDGWLATHDSPDPGKDWEAHVAMPFRKAVRSLSRRERDLYHVQAVSLELGGEFEQTMPRRHGWKKPLWTVSGSRLTFVADGHTRTVPIREMVAWRGAWYVTRLR